MTVMNHWFGDFGRVAIAAALGAAAAAGLMLVAQSSSSSSSQVVRGYWSKQPVPTQNSVDQSMQNEFSRRQRNN